MLRAHQLIGVRDERYRRHFTSADKLHFTLFVMSLTEEQLPLAVQCLHECQVVVHQHFSEPPVVEFEGLSHFKSRVVFVKPRDECMVALEALAQMIHARFREAGLLLDDKFEFTPHATIMKIRFQKGRKMVRLQQRCW